MPRRGAVHGCTCSFMLLGHGGSDWGVMGAGLPPPDPHARRLSPGLASASRNSRGSLMRTGPGGMQAAPGPGLEGVGRAGGVAEVFCCSFWW